MGNKHSGRPGGNPDLSRFQFTTERDDPLIERIQIRVSAPMKQQIKKQDNWHEFVRQAIAEKLEST